MLGLLNAEPWNVRSQIAIHKAEKHVTMRRGATQVVARELPDGQIELLYEVALHEVIRQQLVPELAAKRALEILRRCTEL
jgi:hypothetical protein